MSITPINNEPTDSSGAPVAPRKRTHPYWIECSGLLSMSVTIKRLDGCVWAEDSDHAKELAKALFRERFAQYAELGELDIPGTLKCEAWVLPYQADPCLTSGGMRAPSFCWNPRTCKGRTACPRPISCTE